MTDPLIQDANRALKEAEALLSYLREVVAGQAGLIRKQDQLIEVLEQDAALATSRITELEDTLDSLREGQEAPY